MRAIYIVLLVAYLPLLSRAEIKDVLKSSEIDARLAENRPVILHHRSNFEIGTGSQSGPGSPQKNDGADQVLYFRQGSGEVSVGGAHYKVGPGDVVHIARKTEYRIGAPGGRVGYLAVRIFPSGEGLAPQGGFLAPRKMPDFLSAREIADTLAKFDKNQPIHSAPNFTMNYVIYKDHEGPWESHRDCVDIYSIRMGTAYAQLGGQIQNAKEETPGEMRGASVTGARGYTIGPGDIVVIPRGTAHHMKPATPKLGYLLIKVWAE